MPPKKIVRKVNKGTATAAPATISSATCYSRGSGMTAGLEMWMVSVSGVSHPKFVMFDRSADGRFAGDMATWNSATGLTSTVLSAFVATASA